MDTTFDDEAPRFHLDTQTKHRVEATLGLLLGPTFLVILMIVTAMYVAWFTDQAEYLH